MNSRNTNYRGIGRPGMGMDRPPVSLRRGTSPCELARHPSICCMLIWRGALTLGQGLSTASATSPWSTSSSSVGRHRKLFLEEVQSGKDVADPAAGKERAKDSTYVSLYIVGRPSHVRKMQPRDMLPVHAKSSLRWPDIASAELLSPLLLTDPAPFTNQHRRMDFSFGTTKQFTSTLPQQWQKSPYSPLRSVAQQKSVQT
jgi:hypothetical protein